MWFLGSFCLLFAEQGVPQWKFYCLNCDVTIAEGELSGDLGTDVDVVLKREASCDMFAKADAESGAFLELRKLQVDRFFGDNPMVTSLFSNEDKSSLVATQLFKNSGFRGRTVENGKGLFVVMWSPVSSIYPAIVLAKLERSDLPEAMEARRKWVEARRRGIAKGAEGMKEP